MPLALDPEPKQFLIPVMHLTTPRNRLRFPYVEADETYIGGKMRGRGRGYVGNKTPVVSLVERGGRVRSQVMEMVTGKNITRLLRQQVAATARLK